MHQLGFASLRYSSWLRLPSADEIPKTLDLAPLRYRRRRQSIADDRLGFLQDAAQMIRSPEALRIDLVDVLGP